MELLRVTVLVEPQVLWEAPVNSVRLASMVSERFPLITRVNYVLWEGSRVLTGQRVTVDLGWWGMEESSVVRKRRQIVVF